MGAPGHFYNCKARTVASKMPTGNPASTHNIIQRHSHLIMLNPSTAQIRTAIEVLKKYGEHLNHHASNMAVDLAESPQAIHDAGRITAGTIEQTTALRPSPRSWSTGATN